jgi:hypothetical protein
VRGWWDQVRNDSKLPKLSKALRNPIWDTFIASGISAIEKRKIRPVPRELRPAPLQFAVTAYLLGIDKKARARVFNFVRRTQTVYDEYHEGRSAYLRIFRDQDFDSYLNALSHFEICLAAAYQGHELLFGLSGSAFRDKEVPGRAELNWRMERLYNKSKHVEGMIRAQNFEGDNVPMWISSGGLRTRDETISFDELHDIVFDMSLTGSILAKSHLWRKVAPPLLKKYSDEVRRRDRFSSAWPLAVRLCAGAHRGALPPPRPGASWSAGSAPSAPHESHASPDKRRVARPLRFLPCPVFVLRPIP